MARPGSRWGRSAAARFSAPTRTDRTEIPAVSAGELAPGAGRDGAQPRWAVEHGLGGRGRPGDAGTAAARLSGWAQMAGRARSVRSDRWGVTFLSPCARRSDDTEVDCPKSDSVDTTDARPNFSRAFSERGRVS